MPNYFATCARGLEPLLADELRDLGADRIEPGRGGVQFQGDLATLYRANLWLRTASRVVVRLGRFHASTFYELERRAKRMPWADFLPDAGAVSVRERLGHRHDGRFVAAAARAADPAGDSSHYRIGRRKGRAAHSAE